MHKCSNCEVLIDENLISCPLCGSIVSEKNKADLNRLYPDYETTGSYTWKNFISGFALFLAIAVITECLFVNLITNTRNLWFLYVIGPVLYLLLSVNHTLLSKAHMGTKILFQVVGISSMLVMLDLLSGYYRWSVNIVIPLLFIMPILLITIIVFIKKKLWDDFVGYMMVFTFLGFMPIVLYSVGVSDSIWASAASASYALLTMVVMFLLPGRNFKNEFKRRFYF